MFDGYYAINLEVNKAIADLPDVKTTDHKSRGLDITRTLNGVVQNTANQAIYLNAKTHDGRTIFEVADVIDTGVGHYMLTYPDSMVNVAGDVQIELTIVDPTGTISTNTGTVNVVQAVSNYEDVISAPNYPALLKALNTIQSMETKLTAMQNQVDALEKFETGCIVMSPVALDTRFWVPLDGTIRDLTNYSDLKAIYPNGLPNLSGKVAVAIDSTQAEFNALNQTGGEKVHTLSTVEMPTHIHGLDFYRTIDENVGHYSLVPSSMSGSFIDRGMVYALNDAHSSSFMESTGGSQSHNNLQPYGVIGKFYVHI